MGRQSASERASGRIAAYIFNYRGGGVEKEERKGQRSGIKRNTKKGSDCLTAGNPENKGQNYIGGQVAQRSNPGSID